MKWFACAVIALLCWSGSDLFSKIGCRDRADKYSYLKMVTAVGVVMGLHAGYEVFFRHVAISWKIIFTYLPVSALYILSMAIGYLGLRYIELSISSPICNSSGAIVAVIILCTGGLGADLPPLALFAVALICIGVVGLGFVEAGEDDELRRARQDASNYRYAKSRIAIAIPVVYCLLDALGTFADSKVLEVLDEGSCNVAYELTFLAVGVVCAVFVFGIKRQPILPETASPRLAGAVFETVGQFFYISALADSEHVAFAAPIISAYCVASVVWSRIFLKEKLSLKHYLCIAVTAVGIIWMGVFDI